MPHCLGNRVGIWHMCLPAAAGRKVYGERDCKVFDGVQGYMTLL